MSSSSHPPPPLDRLALAKMKPRDKAALLRQRLLDLGVDAECRRVSSTAGNNNNNNNGDDAGYRLPPASDFEILFTNSPILRHVWENFLLCIFPKAEVRVMRKNLRLVEAKEQKSEAETAKAERRKRAEELKASLDAVRAENAAKQKKLAALNKGARKATADKSRRRESRESAVASSVRRRLSAKAAAKFAEEEKKIEEEKWKPVADTLADFDRVLTRAGEGGDDEEEYSRCRRDLCTAIQAIKLNVSESLPDFCDETIIDRGENSGGSCNNNNNNNTGDDGIVVDDPNSVVSDHLDLLRALLRSHSRSSLIDGLVGETEAGTNLLRDGEAEGGHLDPREASTLDCSLDESGIIVDEAARREEKELKRSREAAKKELQKDIVKVQDEADLCLKQAHQLEASLPSLDADIVRRGRSASLEVLEAEICRLRSSVEEASGRESALAAKRRKLAEVKEAMKLTENVVAALTSEWKRCHDDVVDQVDEGCASVDVTGMKEATKEIRVKSAALANFDQEAVEAWNTIKLDRLPAHYDDEDDEGGGGGGREAAAASEDGKVPRGKGSLVRDCDATSGLSAAAAAAASGLIPPSRQSLPFLVAALRRREDDCRRPEDAFAAKPKIKSLEDAEDAAEVWRTDKIAKLGGGGEAADAAAAAAADDDRNKTKNDINGTVYDDKNNDNNNNNMEANLARARCRMGDAMERCVELTAAGKTLEEEVGFSVLPEVRVDGKSWPEWRAQLKDNQMRRELADRK